MAAIISRREAVCVMSAAAFAASPKLSRAATSTFTGVTGVFPIGTVTYQAMFVAVGKGFTKEEGIDCTIVPAGDGVHDREIVAAGQADFGMGDLLHPMLITERGRPAKALASVDSYSTSMEFMLRADLAAQGIDTLQKFAAWQPPRGGKPLLGVSSIGGTSYQWARRYMQLMGLDNKVTWLGVGNVATMLGALKTKQVDLLTANSSLAVASTNGGYGKVIFDGSNRTTWDKYIGGPVPVTVHYALESTISQKPALTQAWVNAMLRALQFIHTSTPDAIYEAIEPYVGTDRVSDVAGIKIAKDAVNPTGIIDHGDFARGAPVWFSADTKVKPIKLEEVYDGSFIKKANAKYPA